MNEYIVGLDISSSKICGAVGKLAIDKSIQLLGITTSDYSEVKAEIEEADVSTRVNNVISRLEDIIGEPLRETYVSVPISMCEVVNTKGVVSFPASKEINKEDMINVGEVAKFCVNKNQEIVQVDIEEYIVDGMKNIRNPIGMKATVLESEGNAFIANNKYVNEYKKILKNAGIEVKGWIVNSIGMSKDILNEGELHKGVALIDIGSTNSEVTVFKRNKFLDFFSIPLGGDTITNDISICLKLSLEESEKLKFKCNTLLKGNSNEKHTIRVTTADHGKKEIDYLMLEDIICERVKEILEIIGKRLEAENLSTHIESYVVVGGGISQYRDIMSISKDILGKPVRIGVPEYVGAANPIYSTATGIIGYVLSKQQDLIETKNFEENTLEVNGKIKSENKLISKLKGFLKGFSNEEVIK